MILNVSTFYIINYRVCTKIKYYKGGLGGFGLELADWMVLRNSRNIVLTTRTGIRNGYQALRKRVWESYGANVVISTADITTEEGVKQLLNEANKLGPVSTIFNLAVVSIILLVILANNIYLIHLMPSQFIHIYYSNSYMSHVYDIDIYSC